MTAIAQATNVAIWIFAAGMVVASLAIAGKISRTTRCAVRLSIFAIFVGAACELAGGWLRFGEWPRLVLYGGVMSYLVANLRTPSAVACELWANRIAWIITGIVLIIVGATFSSSASAQAPRQLCMTVAQFVRNAAEIRDLGADPAKHRSRTIQAAGGDLVLAQLLVRELERLYRDRLPADRAELEAYVRCMVGARES